MVVELVDDVDVLEGAVLVVSDVIVVGGALVVVELVVLVGEDVELVVVDVLVEAGCVVVDGPTPESLTAGANPRSADNMLGLFPSMPSAQIPSPARSLEEAACATS